MKFDAYDYVGVIVPGSVAIVTGVHLYPEFAPALQSTLSIGDFGLMLVLAFVAGHLIQAAGNLWEVIVWGVQGGMPTTWPAKKQTNLLNAKQLERLALALQRDFESDFSSLKSGRGLIREIFVKIRKSGKTDRIDKFNQNYGLLRGIAVALLISSALVLIESADLWIWVVLLVFAAGVATYRMVLFGKHYAREIFVEYLRADDANPNNATGSQSTNT